MNVLILLASWALLNAEFLLAQKPDSMLTDSLKPPQLIATITPDLRSPAANLSDGQDVMRGEREWRQAWNEAWYPRSLPALPDIDFSQSSVLRAARRFGYGDSVVVDSLRIKADEAVLWVRTVHTCSITPMVLGYVLFIEVPRLPQAVRFVQQTERPSVCR
jgi:hypothetical protein